MKNKKDLSINIDVQIDGEFILCKTIHIAKTIIGTSDIDKWNVKFDEKKEMYKIPISSLNKRKKQLIERKNTIDFYLKNINQILEQLKEGKNASK